jgi:hypothetical protein
MPFSGSPDEILLRALMERSRQVHAHVVQARALRLERAWVESMRAERVEQAEHERQCAARLRTEKATRPKAEQRA